MPLRLTALLLCSTFALLPLAGAAPAAPAASRAAPDQPEEKDAIAMAERAAALHVGKGKEELIRQIAARHPDFVQGSLYIYARDFTTGINIAHPFNHSIVGKNLDDVPDNNGKLYRKDIMAVAKKEGKGWVDYMYKNPESNKVEPKTAYVLRSGDVVLVAGVYKK